MIKYEEITFFSNGIPVSGTFSRNSDWPEPCPAVILAHGYANYRGEFGGFDELARILNDHNISVLQFDFRGCGDSGGVKGRMMCATEWPTDLMNAVTWLSSREEVNQDRISVIGQSMGATTTAYVSSLDERIACAVCMAPTSNGRQWLEEIWVSSRGKAAWEGFWKEVTADRVRCALTGKSQILPIYELLAMDNAGKENWISLNKQYPKFLMEAPLESIDSVSYFRPIDVISASKCPLLFIHGLEDGLVPNKNSIELFGKANEPKEIYLIPEAGHDLPIGNFKTIVQNRILKFLEQYLRRK